MINIKFPDQSIRQYPEGVTGLEIARSINEGLARKVLAIKLNGEVWDVTRPIFQDASIRLLTWDDDEGKATMWHSSAHLMAEAIESLYPGVKFGVGPDIENGFYYDIDFGDYQISSDDFKKIEDRMLELARQKQEFKRRDVSKAEALEYFRRKGDEYKIELINDLEDGSITLYETGQFTDLCRGPHLPNTSPIKAVKLLSIAGAYWRGDEKRKMLTRLYGITFPKAEMLAEFLNMLEEAKKRDHRKIGKELDLFHFSSRVGNGLPLWTPRGALLRERLTDFLKKELYKRGYVLVASPHIGNVNLYKTSGHYEKYGADSFRPISTPEPGEEFMLKPMNCPHHCEIYNRKPMSYKELPQRYAEFGTVYRYEQSGVLHGLTRVRGFTQDDAHIFCRPDQLKEEFIGVIDLVLFLFKTFDFNNFIAQVSLRDPENKIKYIGSDENWDRAEQAIIEAAEEKNLNPVLVKGEAAFYGPKLDFIVKDAIGRKWQLSTIQVDYNLPERFELEYIGADNQRHRPIMIHRAIFGSIERFVAVMLEHTAGKFPLWLAPTQAIILPVSEKFHNYAENILQLLKNCEIRSLIDDRSEKIGKKIRDAELQRIPYMLIVGEKEENNNTVSVRKQGQGDMGSFKVQEFVDAVEIEVQNFK
ncbi:MAG TPA: threonine--tRNA ligase [Bacteroidales bacterium]|jgi:threonyl-tRNA synthetase|nr:threonine--tRNA ligase [Bacteroidales bacterium]MDI9573839.1 threonine--tRNA ligase [Bacteroidota bacterium]MBP9511811.1 threonine--tRNA ligase [Bacteroidales bacterium]NMD16035.1 threonine--tRNA ligase [Bacteroidales bacterium]HNQ60130.1 threonine--tRNA ligase [Bacteroidales bacterium]